MTSPETFVCALCARELPLGDEGADAAAREELRATFGEVPIEACAIVCDDCWEVIRP